MVWGGDGEEAGVKYHASALDKKLESWFVNDNAHAHLRQVHLRTGHLRGLSSVQMQFDYPITVVAGKNGCGKSTVLAMCACAYHNGKSGVPHKSRKATYYTFANFFIQSQADVPPEGVEIAYEIAHNNWKGRPPGKAWQVRRKRVSGKWNNYAGRVNRNVVFLGIDRVVPHAEKGPSRSYSRRFVATQAVGIEEAVRDAVGYVLARAYTTLSFATHGTYRLPVVESTDGKYSGFNMGAGENALFELFATIYTAGTGALIIVDELELGLHVEAQKRLVQRLKEICLQRQIQLICTSHSSHIFGCVPPHARLFVERHGGHTSVLTEVSPEYAFHKLSAAPTSELLLLVEDDVAKGIISAVLPAGVRARVAIEAVGSASVLARQLASVYVRETDQSCFAVFDGDQAGRKAVLRDHFVKMTERQDGEMADWFDAHSLFLPGDSWPESWLLARARETPEFVGELVNCPVLQLGGMFEHAFQAGKHSEFYEMGRQLNLPEETVRHVCCLNVQKHHAHHFADLISSITKRLNET